MYFKAFQDVSAVFGRIWMTSQAFKYVSSGVSEVFQGVSNEFQRDSRILGGFKGVLEGSSFKVSFIMF